MSAKINFAEVHGDASAVLESNDLAKSDGSIPETQQPECHVIASALVDDETDPLAIREKILRLQGEMMKMAEHQIECPVRHIFAPGLYAREIFIPKGAVVVGKIHKHAHVNTISKGRCSVMTEFGPKEIEAPHTFVSDVGTKRVVVALDDVIWTTYHPSTETDLQKLEEEIIAKGYDDIALSDSTPDLPQVKGE